MSYSLTAQRELTDLRTKGVNFSAFQSHSAFVAYH